MKVKEEDEHNEVLSCDLVSRKDQEDYFSSRGPGHKGTVLECSKDACIVQVEDKAGQSPSLHPSYYHRTS